ncbi:hypothetical protein SCA6_018770 [Theobroma cacao]
MPVIRMLGGPPGLAARAWIRIELPEEANLATSPSNIFGTSTKQFFKVPSGNHLHHVLPPLFFYGNLSGSTRSVDSMNFPIVLSCASSHAHCLLHKNHLLENYMYYLGNDARLTDHCHHHQSMTGSDPNSG